jgi:hypothetical protein
MIATRATIAAIAATLLSAGSPALASPKVDWDQVENIKKAATQIGQLQRRQGATKAFELIVACYKTHGAASKYSRFFESCIAQDYMHTQTLAALYARMSPAALKKAGAPSPKMLADAMGQRVAGAFSKYEVPVTDANAFKKLVDKHGFPIYAKIMFGKPKKGGQAKPDDPSTGGDTNDSEPNQ